MSKLLIVDDEPGMRQLLSIVFGREGHEPNSAAGRILKSAELVPVRGTHMLFRMRSARAVLRRDVRAFQVKHRRSGSKLAIRLRRAL